MNEVFKFPSVFQNWETTESIIRKHLDGQIPPAEEDEVVYRFKEIFDRLPARVGEVSLPLDGLEHLSERDLDLVYNALGACMDQIQEELQSFAGQVLGEIFGLVLELSRVELRMGQRTSA